MATQRNGGALDDLPENADLEVGEVVEDDLDLGVDKFQEEPDE